jgi:hypothetical protein
MLWHKSRDGALQDDALLGIALQVETLLQSARR